METGGAMVGEAAATGRTGGAAVVAGACCLRIAFRTSPGREILDRSILVLISSPTARLGRDGLAAVCASLAARKYARTFSASCSSTELECVFFSVTPTSGSASRIALLLTSSSLARSLIRILLIRSFFPPDYPAKSSYQPHGVGFRLHASRLHASRSLASTTRAKCVTLSLLFAFGRSRLFRRFLRLLFRCRFHRFDRDRNLRGFIAYDIFHNHFRSCCFLAFD